MLVSARRRSGGRGHVAGSRVLALQAGVASEAMRSAVEVVLLASALRATSLLARLGRGGDRGRRTGGMAALLMASSVSAGAGSVSCVADRLSERGFGGMRVLEGVGVVVVCPAVLGRRAGVAHELARSEIGDLSGGSFGFHGQRVEGAVAWVDGRRALEERQAQSELAARHQRCLEMLDARVLGEGLVAAQEQRGDLPVGAQQVLLLKMKGCCRRVVSFERSLGSS